MKHRKGRDLKRHIIKALGEEPRTLWELEKIVNTSHQTITLHCQELEDLGIITSTRNHQHPQTGRPYTIIKLTNYGKSLFTQHAKRARRRR